MIQKLIKNDLTRRRWRTFKAQKRAAIALILLGVISFFSFTAEIWSNNKPLVMSYQDSLYFPVFKTYHPTQFGITTTLVTDYRALSLDAGDWAIWPPLKWDPFESNREAAMFPGAPSGDNWFGTDDRGRDVLSRLLYGYRYSMTYALLVWAISAFLAVSIGGMMGYAGGWVDLIGQRVVEVQSSVPYLFLLIILISIFQPSLGMLVALTSIFGWISLSYYMRGEFLRNRKREYVEAARSLGGGHLRLIFKHILPNSLVPIVTLSPFIIAMNVNGLAALDYLGFGLQPPTPSWGELLNQAQRYFTIAWWLALFPSLALFSTLVLLAFVGDGFRNAFDPKKG
jgi:microcin C transport system permease protein